jgi:hypothetical protein
MLTKLVKRKARDEFISKEDSKGGYSFSLRKKSLECRVALCKSND